MIMDPVNPDRIFFGKDSILRSESGGISGSWEYIGSPSLQPVNVLTQGINDRNRLYASQNSTLYKSDNAITSSASNVTWSPISTTPFLSQFITDIVVDPDDADHVFVTLGGYLSGVKVFESINGGASFDNISGSLPDVPILCMAYHDDGNGLDRLYIGTDIGVFYSDNTIGDWIYFSNYLPAVPVEDLYINTANNTITAGSYGRGLWRSDLIAPCNDNKYFSSGTTHLGTYHFTYNNTITSLAKVSTQPGTSITYKAGDWIDLKPGFRAPATSVIEIKIGGCPY